MVKIMGSEGRLPQCELHSHGYIISSFSVSISSFVKWWPYITRIYVISYHLLQWLEIIRRKRTHNPNVTLRKSFSLFRLQFSHLWNEEIGLYGKSLLALTLCVSDFRNEPVPENVPGWFFFFRWNQSSKHLGAYIYWVPTTCGCYANNLLYPISNPHNKPERWGFIPIGEWRSQGFFIQNS